MPVDPKKKVFCVECGKECRIEEEHQGYDEGTGKPIITAYAFCPNATSWLLKFNHTWHKFAYGYYEGGW